MEKSTVYVSMYDKNNIGCSYAIIKKADNSVIIIFKDLECGIYDYDALLNDDFNYHYLLLKHYETTTKAYKDFMKLIGKMCKKSVDCKYFKDKVDEDNWMIFEDDENEHMILEEEKDKYSLRKDNFTNYIIENKDKFLKDDI